MGVFISGTSVSVYGIFSWFNLGSLAATYTVDGTTVTQTYNSTSLERGNEEGEAFNFLYYSLDNLSPADHTLVVNVTVADNQSFALDYITYLPSFETPSLMPRLNDTTTTTTTSVEPSSSSLRPSLVQNSGTSQPWQMQRLQIAIVGGVIGVVALGVLLGVWSLLRRRKAKPESGDISQYLYQGGRLRIMFIPRLLSELPSIYLSRCERFTHTKSY
jgi:hypothetical protein